jgi:GTPase SAR1 family protein
MKMKKIHPSYCIEFFGLPASGKTTIVKRLRQEYPDLFIAPNDYWVVTKYFSVGNFFILLPKIFVLLEYCLKFHASPFNRRFLSVVSCLNRYCLGKRQRKIYLIDHGIIQNFISSKASLNFRLMLLDLFKNKFFTLEGYRFVYIEGNTNMCMQREINRQSFKKNILQELPYFYQLINCQLAFVTSVNLFPFITIPLNNSYNGKELKRLILEIKEIGHGS